MAGEIIHAKTLEEAKIELRAIYKKDAAEFQEISKEQYESRPENEREDSDNHLNEEKLGIDADIIDLAYYKYLPDRKVLYRIVLKHKNSEQMEDYFMITPEMNQS